MRVVEEHHGVEGSSAVLETPAGRLPVRTFLLGAHNLDNLAAARDNLYAARLNLVRSEDLLEQMTMRLRLGKTDYLTVLEAEASRSLARSNLIEARFEVLTLTASLKRAIGFSPMLPLTAIEGLVKGETE